MIVFYYVVVEGYNVCVEFFVKNSVLLNGKDKDGRIFLLMVI